MIEGSTPTALALALAGAALVAFTGQGTPSGALLGLLVAVLAIMGLGPGALLPLATFVLAAGAVTRLGRARKEASGTAQENRGRRGMRHVVAKLGLPALLGLAGILSGGFGGAWGAAGSAGGGPLAFAYAAALAGALADTAATEVGPLAGGAVLGFRGGRLRSLAHGDPGGMSAAGLAAAAAGAAAVAWSAHLTRLTEGVGAGSIVTLAGFGASFLESLVGGTAVGRGLGHFGRNALVSVTAGLAGFGAGLIRSGVP